MSDLIDFMMSPQSVKESVKVIKPELPELTVSEISFEIKRFVETTFNKVRVRGEIFGAKRADSGHYYLSLKDENAVLSAVCWKGVAAQLAVKPEDGLEVIATGKITTFAGKSSYQLVIEQMEVAGTGALLKLLEERKKQYAAEGLFDIAHKQKIPYLTEVIGVVTSASGAVIRDIIHRIRDRFPRHIIVWPTPVQGEGAAEKIASAIKGFNDMPNGGNIPKPDVLIVARGGGSLEDLWPFNEDVVIRAVYNSKIPLISAVGHETDTMLIDYVADMRAPTPTGAAEFAVPVKSELLMQISNFDNRLKNGIFRYFEERKSVLDGLGRGIPNLAQILLEYQQKLDDRVERLHISFKQYLQNKSGQISQLALRPYYIKNIIERKNESFQNLSIRLENVSIESVLRRGFVWVRDKDNNTIYSVADAQKLPNMEICFADGTIDVVLEDNAKVPVVKKDKKGKKNENLQADLFGM